LISWVTSRWLDDGEFIVWQFGIAKCILTVALLQNSFSSDSFGEKETEGAVFENRRISLGFVVDSVFKVA
jgi:hypothetical protein